MAILGMRHDESWITGQRPENWRQTILLLYPNSAEIAKAPLTALTSMIKEEKTDDPAYHFFSKKLDDRRLKLSANIDGTVTTIPIDSAFKTAKIVKLGDMLQIEQTKEIVRVAADPTSDTAVVVTRAQAGTAGTAVVFLTSNPYLIVIGSSFEEGSLAPTGVNYDVKEDFNYTQIFRSTLEMTRTAAKTRLRTGDQVAEAKRECLEYFSVDMERAFWFNGDRALLTNVNGKPLRLTRGLIKSIQTGAPNNVVAAPAGGLIDMDWLEMNLEIAFRFGSSEKLMFGANKFLLAINQAVRKNSHYNIDLNTKTYGMRIARIVTPFGEIAFKVHPLFNQMQGGIAADTTTPFLSVANNGYLLDMANIRYRYLDDIQYEKDLTTIGLDGQKSGYLAECGLEVHHPETHFIFTGVIGGVADS